MELERKASSVGFGIVQVKMGPLVIETIDELVHASIGTFFSFGTTTEISPLLPLLEFAVV